MPGKPETSRIRWIVCALLFFATTINYFDRQLFSLLVPFFEDDLRLGPTDLALINVSFLLAYGFGMVFVGRAVDRVGTRKGLGGAFVVWNLASLAHALVRSLGGFAVARFLLGLGESANFPASVRTVAEWFPKRERALATGWFNSGANVGAILAPLLAVSVAEAYGWRACFLVLGGLGFVWIFFWNRLYRRPEDHPRLSASELALIRSDPPETVENPSFEEVFGMRPVYAVAAAKFFTEPPWWFFLTWLPKFLIDTFKLGPIFMAYAIPIVFVASDLGSIAGGWLSSRLIESGRSVNASRKIAMLVCALCATPVSLVGWVAARGEVAGVPSVYVAVAIISLAAAAHQGWSCNLFTVVSDSLPKNSVAMAVGAVSAVGVVGAAAFQLLVGRSVQLTGSYAVPFALAGGLYLVGLLALHLLMPKIEPVEPRRRVPLPAIFAGGIALLAALLLLQTSLNRPPYASLDDYLAKRSVELHLAAAPTPGPRAAVGWMPAQWFVLHPVGASAKAELVKLDRSDRPYVEPAGARASKYRGPTAEEISRLTG